MSVSGLSVCSRPVGNGRPERARASVPPASEEARDGMRDLAAVAGGAGWAVDARRAKQEVVAREAHVDVALLATVRPEGGSVDVGDLAEAGACGFKVSIYDTDPKRFPRIPDLELLDVFAAAA